MATLAKGHTSEKDYNNNQYFNPAWRIFKSLRKISRYRPRDIIHGYFNLETIKTLSKLPPIEPSLFTSIKSLKDSHRIHVSTTTTATYSPYICLAFVILIS